MILSAAGPGVPGLLSLSLQGHFIVQGLSLGAVRAAPRGLEELPTQYPASEAESKAPGKLKAVPRWGTASLPLHSISQSGS